MGAPSVEEICSQAVVMSSFFFRFRRGNSFSCTSGLKNLFFSAVNKNTNFDRLEEINERNFSTYLRIESNLFLGICI